MYPTKISVIISDFIVSLTQFKNVTIMIHWNKIWKMGVLTACSLLASCQENEVVPGGTEGNGKRTVLV